MNVFIREKLMLKTINLYKSGMQLEPLNYQLKQKVIKKEESVEKQ